MTISADWKRQLDIDVLRRKRVSRIQQGMVKFGLDAVVAFEYANGRYIGGLRPLYAPNFQVRQAVIATRQSSDVICFVHLDDTPHRRKTMYWLPEGNIREFPTGAVLEGAGPEAIAPVGNALRELGFSKGRVGVDIGTAASLRNLATLLDGESELVDANACFNWARSAKFPEEVSLARLAAAAVDSALDVAVNSIRPGISECEVLAEVMRELYRHNAEVPQCNLIVATGDNTAPMQRFASDALVRPGDIVFMDIGACFNGIFSEAARTVACGEPNHAQRAIYKEVHQLHEAIIGAVQPGITGAQLQAIAAEVLRDCKYRSNLQKMIIAHGIGVGYAEPPYISPPGKRTSDFTLEEGVMLAIVPTMIVEGISGGGGVRLEDIVAVSADGVERLTRYPYDHSLLS